MTASHSSGRRHRGRRGRRSGNRTASPEQTQEQVASTEPVAEVAVAAPEQVEVPVAPPALRVRPELSRGGPRNDTRPPMRPMRRRPQPRQPVGPMPTEVLKRGLQLQEPEFPLQLRTVATMIEESAANFGCPMLHRNQTALPATGSQRPARCNLGWAIHDQDEAMLCMYTAEMIDCWKAHPENIAGLIEKIQQDEETPAAD